MTEEEKKIRILELEMVISQLEHNAAFLTVINDKKKTIEFCDNSWHLINLDEKDKLLELKYAKIAAENMVNTIQIYKQELESLKGEDQEQTSYFEE